MDTWMGQENEQLNEEDSFDKTVSAFSEVRHVKAERVPKQEEEDDFVPMGAAAQEDDDEEDFDRTVSAFSHARPPKTRRMPEPEPKPEQKPEPKPEPKPESGPKGADSSVPEPGVVPEKGIGARKPMNMGLKLLLILAAVLYLAGSFVVSPIAFMVNAVLVLVIYEWIWGSLAEKRRKKKNQKGRRN